MIEMLMSGLFIMLIVGFVAVGEFLIDKMEGADWDVR